MKLNGIFRYSTRGVEKKMKTIQICLRYGLNDVPQQSLSAPPQQHRGDNSFINTHSVLVQQRAELGFKYWRPS